MKKSITFIVLIIILVTTGCKKTHNLNERQHILFQYDYVNYSWGYIHEGFYINDEGQIMHYSNPGTWNHFSPDYILSEKQLAENLSACTISDMKINKEDLVKYSSYIDNISSSKVTAQKNVAMDAGTGIYICYSFDEQNSIYKGKLIRMEGDFTCENLNFYSKKVTAWLSDINDKVKNK